MMSLKRKIQTCRSSISSTWKCWLLLNYEPEESSYVSVEEIIEHAKSEKENYSERELTARSLGIIVKDTWEGRVIPIKKKGVKSRLYRNLARRKPSKSSNECSNLKDIQQHLQQLQLPDRWQLISENERLSIVKTENIEVNGGRLTTEICVQTSEDKFTVFLKSLGRECPCSFLEVPIIEKIVCMISLVEGSRLCKGNEGVQCTQVLCISGTVRDTCSNTEQLSFFSKKCTILAQPETDVCAECSYLNRLHGTAKRRKTNKGETVHPHCNHRYMTKVDLISKIHKQSQIKQNAIRREKYWREKYVNECLDFEAQDHSDLMSIFDQVQKQDVPEDMACLWEQQKKIINTQTSKAYRWHPKVIRLCIELYCKNPHVLDSLRKFIYLPSNRTIRNYKNKVEQAPGWTRPILSWCLQEAKARKLSEADYWGGFVIDEMKIQEDLEMVYRNGKHRLVGFVELGPAHDSMAALSGKNEEPQLASQVLQFVFLSDGGFRFPVAQFPSRDCTPSDLYLLFWEGVMKMFDFGFTVYWTILDGAECNRQFIKMHFLGVDPKVDQFVTHNPSTGNPMIFMVDSKHNFKKIRNNLEKSRLSEKPRCLVINGKKTLWKHFVDAFNWDQKSNSLPIHEKLTARHFDLDPSSKMRNHLAEDVLDVKMLFLVQEFQKEISRNGDDDSFLDGAVTLLQHTSSVIDLFSNKYSIKHVRDSRLKNLNDFLSFIEKWRAEVPDKNFISAKLHFDLQAMCLGFNSMIRVKLLKFPHSVIKPAIVNQDCIENHFCQVRSCNRQNDNPTYLLQESAQNSIRFGQTTISRKSNAGIMSTKSQACSVPLGTSK